MGQWPFYFLLCVFLVQNVDFTVCGIDERFDYKNVGTVLFDQTHLKDHCWTEEEQIILNTRRIFQDLIPKIENSKNQSSQFITDILDYYGICVERINKLAIGVAKELVLKSFADIVGGYLQTFVVPLTKSSFYAGNVRYCKAVKIMNLLDEIKAFLKTTGVGWKSAQSMDYLVEVTPLDLPNRSSLDACDVLIIDSTATYEKHIYKKKRRKKGTERDIPDYSDQDLSCENDHHRRRQATLQMFLPYFDDDFTPNSIALPFKNRKLWSLYARKSVAVLTKYYAMTISCLRALENSEENIGVFRKNFKDWLLQSVYPLLKDDKWYPAFGGVLQIMADLEDNGQSVKKVFVTPPKKIQPLGDTVIAPKSGGVTETAGLIVIALSTAACVLLILGICLYCYGILRKHPHQCSPGDSYTESGEDSIMENEVILERCPSSNSRKSVGEKVREWCAENLCSKKNVNDRVGGKDDKFPAYEYRGKSSMCKTGDKRTYKIRKKDCHIDSYSGSPNSSPRAAFRDYCFSSELSSSDSSDS